MRKGSLLYLIFCFIVVFSFSGLSAQEVIFSENFNQAQALPDGWTNIEVNHHHQDYVWQFVSSSQYGNPGGSNGVDTNIMDGNIAVIAVEAYPMPNASLITPAIDVSELSNLTLTFHQARRQQHGNAYLELSFDSENWHQIAHYTNQQGVFGPPVYSVYDLSEYLDDADEIYIRWRWFVSGYSWWAIDNVEFITFADYPAPATLTGPADEAEYLPVNTALSWQPQAMGPQPTGYTVYIDTDTPPTASFDVTDGTTYQPELSYGETYYWRVVPYNNDGSTPLEDCEIRSFAVHTEEPYPAIITSPANGADEISLETILVWQPNSIGYQPTSYKVYFDDFTPPTTEYTVTEGTSLNVADLDPGTVYYWRVIPYVNGLPTPVEDCPIWSFTTYPAEPLPAVIVSPADGTVNLPPSLNLEWQPNSTGIQPTGYKLYFDDFTPPTTEYDITEGTSYEISNLDFSTDYYWQVVPYTGEMSADENNCPIWTFTTHPAEPLAAVLISPANGTTSAPPLVWQAAQLGEQPTGYRVYFDTNDPPTALVYQGADTSYSPDFSFETTYYWRVVAYNNEGDAEASPVWSFSTPVVYSLPFTENFNAGVLPEGWTNTEANYPGQNRVWRFDNPGNQNIGGNFEGNFAILDQQFYGYIRNPNIQARLTTPAIDCSDAAMVILSFDQQYRHFGTSFVTAEVQVSTDGEVWQQVQRLTSNTGYTNPVRSSYDITGFAAGAGTVYVRWLWDAYAYWWAIDNVSVEAIPGYPLPVVMNSPVNNSENISPDASLNWSASSNPFAATPTGYTVYLDSVNPPVQEVYDGENTTFAPELDFSTTYYWRVVPYANGNVTPVEDTAVWSFTTASEIPLPVTMLSPANEAVSVLASQPLQWQPAAAGVQPDSYQLYFGTDNPPQTMVYEGANTTYQPNYDPETTYYWQVIPFADGISTPTEDCPVWSFTSSPVGEMPFDEGFTGTLPSGWSTYGPGDATWAFDNPTGKQPGGNFDQFFAIYDSEFRNDGTWYLQTIPIDMSDTPNAILAFDLLLHGFSYSGASLTVGVSSDNVNWTTVYSVSSTYDNVVGPVRIYTDVTDYAANQASFFVRWGVYVSSYWSSGGWCAIDNVSLYSLEGVPQPAVLVSPVNGANDLALNTTLNWQAPTFSTEIDGYEVYFGTDEELDVAGIAVGDTTQYAPELDYGTVYYWQVVPYNNAGSTAREDSAIWSFETTFIEPLPVTLVSPEDGANGVYLNADLAWQPNSAGVTPTGYKLYLDDVNPPVEFTDVGNVTTYAPGLAGSTTYYWGVLPYTEDAEASFQDALIRSFTTNDPEPLAATLIAPADGATYVPVYQELSWQPAEAGEAATGFRVYFGTDNPPTEVIYSGADTAFLPNYDFDTTYYWQVVAYNEAGDADATTIRSLTTTTAFSLPFSENFDTSPTIPLGWSTEQRNETRPAERVWYFNNPSGRSIGGNFSGNFAINDAQHGGWVHTPPTDAILTTPPIDCSDVENVTISFDQRLYAFSNASNPFIAHLKVSTNGVDWHVVAENNISSGAHPPAEHVLYDISEYADGQPTVYIRWRASMYAYYWAIDNVELFSMPNEPYPVTLNSPADGAQHLPISTTLSWTAATVGADPTGYTLYLDTVDPPQAEFDIEDAETTTYAPTLAYNTTYYWRVVPYNASGAGNIEESEIRSFHIHRAEPYPATVVSPPNEQFHLDPEEIETLNWTPSTLGYTPPDGYRVYFGTTNPPTELIFTGTNTSVNISEMELVDSTTYYWQVVPFSDEHGDAQDNPIWRFTTLQPALAEGTYIVNLDPDTGDFSNMRQVVEALTFRGITGPVVFDFNPGLYDDGGATMPSMILRNVEGAGGENTITFTNSNDTEAAIFSIVTGWSSGASINSLLFIDGMSNIRIENLQFLKQSGSAEAAVGAVWSNNIEIVNCIFSEQSNSTFRALRAENSNNILFERNTVTSNQMGGIWIAGSDQGYISGIEIRNNKFEVLHYAVYLSTIDPFIFSNNVVDITRSGSNHGTLAIRLLHTRGPFLFDSNRIFFSNNGGHYGINWGDPGFPFYGIPPSGGHISTGKEPAIFVNNSIGGGFSYNQWTTGAFRIEAPIEFVHFYYNSFHLDLPGTATSTNFNVHTGSSRLTFINNSFAYTGGGNGRAFSANPGMIDAFDYNNFYSNGNNFVYYGAAVSTLAELRAVDGKNQNSRVGDPQYNTTTDLNSFGVQLWQAGTPIDGFYYDIDGNERHATTPNIGAYEFEPIIDHDLAAIALSGPFMLTVGAPSSFQVTLENPGSLFQDEYTVKLMKEDHTELVSVNFTEPIIWGGQTEVVTIQWTPTEEGIYEIYARVVLENDQNPYNDVSPMHAVYVEGLTELPAPVVTLTVNPVTNEGILSWEAITGANSYKVYGSFEPYNENEWILLTVTADTEVTANLAGYGDKAFFRVIASTDAPTMFIGTPSLDRIPSLDRRTRNNNTRGSGLNPRTRGE